MFAPTRVSFVLERLPHYSQTPRRARLRRSLRASEAETKICIAVTVRENSPLLPSKGSAMFALPSEGSHIFVWGVLGGVGAFFQKVPHKNPASLKIASPRITRVVSSFPKKGRAQGVQKRGDGGRFC